MGLGPPVCMNCLAIGKLTNEFPGHLWVCPSCNGFDLKGSLFTFTIEFQDMLRYRSNLFTVQYPKTSRMKTEYTTHRKFMSGNNHPFIEPNDYYRPWLEQHIGKQGVDWAWDLCKSNIDLLEITFADKEHGTLFELSWPQ